MIREPGAAGSLDASQVGGKAASLFRLTASGFQAPPFFVITADTYRAHPRGRLSAAARDAVLAAWARLGGDAYAYAVRSSGVAEDSKDDSFAGVFETVLDVRGAEALIAAVEHCWASHRSARAAAYRGARRVSGDTGMAVVVQRMVQASWAGVSFTADPLSQALSVTVVNAVPGGGDPLVSGLVNPEQVRVRTADGAVLDRIVPAGAAPLPDALLAEVVRVSNAAATAYGFPQDLEWAVEDGQVWLLQSRPITTVAGVVHNRPLEPWAPGANPDAPDRVWSRAYADEIWTPPVSPLFYDVQHLAGLVTGGIVHSGDTAPLPAEIFKYYRAAAYVDTDVLVRLYAGYPPIARRPGLFAQLPADRRERLRQARWNVPGALRRTWLFEVVRGRRWGLTRNHRFLATAWDGFVAETQPLMDADLSQLSAAELDRHIADVFAVSLTIGVECQVAVVYHAQDLKLLLTGLLDRWFGDGERLYAEVSSGLPDSRTVAEAQAIWSMARLLDGAGLGLETLAWADARQEAERRGLSDFLRAFDRFRAEHRHRGAHYKDLIHPRWGDDPALLWAQVRAMRGAGGASPAEANAAASVRREAAQAELLARASGLQRAALRPLLALNERYAALRDNHRFYYDRIWWLLRRAFHERGRRAAAAGRLAGADDVFHLCRAELGALEAGALDPQTAAARIESRRAEWEATRLALPPAYLTAGYAPITEASEETHGTLRGVAASAGEAEGRARVLHDISELHRLAPGDVLVTRQTDPSWSPVFPRLAGLVLETGGVLAHGASLCREFGLPCVTAVEAATQRIRDGDRVRVRGAEGLVEVLEPADAAPTAGTPARPSS